MTPEEKIQYLITHPDELIRKKPFTRGKDSRGYNNAGRDTSVVNQKMTAQLPDFGSFVVDQETFLRELDPECHSVLFDDNVPSITVKNNDGKYVEIEFKKMAVPFQRMIAKKQTRFLCGYGIQHTLDNISPSDAQKEDYAKFRQGWLKRNQDGMRTKMVYTQKTQGDAGLLFYFDRKGEIKSRLLAYSDGYVLCPHNDDNGDRLLESVYYRVGDEEYIDSWDDRYQYRHIRSVSKDTGEMMWSMESPKEHGFNEIPLVTKRGEVAWNGVQSTIEVYEIIYNIFLVIQKRHGWGILYIKGNFSDSAKKLAGAIVLNDASLSKDGSAQYLTPPSPQGMLDTLKLMEETIQKGSGTTFILPKDISTTGDVSGIAIQIAQSLDNEESLGGVIEWQNVADKMTRLFMYGYAKELVNKGDLTAITRFGTLDVSASFKQWRPRNDYEYNQMLTILKGNGILSQKTAIEKNTESTPDELLRMQAQDELDEAKASATNTTGGTIVTETN